MYKDFKFRKIQLFLLKKTSIPSFSYPNNVMNVHPIDAKTRSGLGCFRSRMKGEENLLLRHCYVPTAITREGR